MRQHSKKKPVTTNNIVIYSAALQDHYLRTNQHTILEEKRPKMFPNIYKKKTVSQVATTEQKKRISELQKEEKKSILPYENVQLKKIKQSLIEQQKMKIYNSKLTLAQKLGIVQAPPLPLSSKEWYEIQEKCRKRNDIEGVCAICLEPFKMEKQSILSCSHVFHEDCLRSYQKHNKVRSCPICRRRDYEIKIIDEAIKAFTIKSILRIQRVWRGSRDRIKFYAKLVEEGYKPSSKLFNRRLIGYRMWKLSHKIEEQRKKREEYLTEMLNKLQKKHEIEKQEILDEIVEVQRKKIMEEGKVELYLRQLGIEVEKDKKAQNINWQQAKDKGISRNDQQCSICLQSLWSRPVYLLSCSHLFHVNCIESFQRYAVGNNKNKCPCCRSEYEKKCLKKQHK